MHKKFTFLIKEEKEERMGKEIKNKEKKEARRKVSHQGGFLSRDK